MKIAVISGGLSPERDVSLSSGALIANALVRGGHAVAFADLFFGLELPDDPDTLFRTTADYSYTIPNTEPDLDAVRRQRKNGDPRSQIGEGIIPLCLRADLVFLALHGASGENGQFQALLDLYGVRYTGSGYAGALLAMDKDLSKCMIRQSGVLVPNGITLATDELGDLSACAEKIRRDVGFPCVIKPASCGSSIGVSMVDRPEELTAALEAASRYHCAVLAERRIFGREFSVGVLNGKALPPIEIIPLAGFYDYKNKYQSGMTKEICPADLTPEQTREMGKQALAVHRALRLGSYSRVDFLMENETGKMYALEANTLPGMTPSSLLPQEAAADGMDYDTLCRTIAELALTAEN